MLSKKEVLSLIGEMESDFIEHTVSTINTDKFGEAICALSNDMSNRKESGFLFIGVKDKQGELSGLRVSDELLRNISGIRSDGNILPQPSMSVYHYSYDKGDVLIVEVFPAHFPPVRYKGRVWIRIGPRKAIANEMEERLLMEKRTSNVHTFDELPCPNAKIEDLDIELFKQTYLPRAIDKEILINDTREIKLQLATLRFYDLVYDCPTNAGVLMFGKDTKYFFPGVYVQYVKFDGKSVTDDVLKEKVFTGNLIFIAKDLDTFVKNVIIDERPELVSVLREESVRNYPHWAIREFLMNALMHRSYEINAPIKFYQYSDSLQIVNPGGLYGNARPENFPNVSDYRNLVIAEAMKVMGYVNRFNRGIATAQANLLSNGNLEAEFDINTIGIFEVRMKEKKLHSFTPPIGGVSGGVNGGVIDLTQEEEILKILSIHKGIRTPQLCELTGFSKRTIERFLNQLKKKNLILFKGSSKTGGYFLID
jgi:ATP-dependent DNA helicase RecG